MLDPTQTVARVVLDHSETAAVFLRNRIDYCCRGDVSIETACERVGLDPGALIGELTQVISERNGRYAPDPRRLSTISLIAHIVSVHHEYLRRALPFISELTSKVAGVHGERNARLIELEQLVGELAESLRAHIDAEEQSLFPALIVKTPDAAIVSLEFASMHEDHLVVGRMLERLRAVTEDFAVPAWACNSYRALFAELAQLEGDVLTHVHLENHVLMPRFIDEAAART